MHPKMSLKEAESILGLKPHSITQRLKTNGLPYTKDRNKNYFTHTSSRFLYKNTMNLDNFVSTVIAIQIVKGGTGKTALTINLASRLSLIGFRVLMIDLDQQANLTRYCNIDSEERPAMIEILEKKVEVKDTIIEVSDGLFLIPSKIDNALLDDFILIKGLSLKVAIKKYIDPLKSQFDFILIDCPPSLGKSVGAAALASDLVIAPVTPDEQCLSGLRLLRNGLLDLKEISGNNKNIPYSIVLNQYELKTIATNKMVNALEKNEEYRQRMFKTTIKKSQEFKNKCDSKESIYDSLTQSIAKIDIDFWTQEVINVSRQIHSLPGTQTKKRAKEITVNG